MPWNPAAKDQLPPRAPAPVAAPLQAGQPFVPASPLGHVDNNRAWSRDGAQMTPELHRDTKPYLDALMRMGGDFKNAHATKYDEKREAKLLKRYNQDHPLAANASPAEQAAHAAAARQMLEDFQARLPANMAIHEATRDLRNAFKKYDAGNYDPAAQKAFEDRYAVLCQQAGRLEPSPLELALPRESPLRTKLDPLTGGLRDPASGLYANMVKMGEGAVQKNVLIFGGTGVGGAKAAQVQADLGQFMGGVPKAYRQAAELAGQIQQNLPAGQRLETAGHSLGGGLAHYAALKNGGIQATCFNAAALGGGCKAAIGGNLAQAKANVRHINVLGDGVGDGIGQARVPLQKIADERNLAALKEGAQALRDGVRWGASTSAGLAAKAGKAAADFVGKEVDKRFGEDIGRLKAGAAELKDQVIGAVPEPLRQAGGLAAGAAGDAAVLAKQMAGGAADLAAAAAKRAAQPLRQAAQLAGGAALAAGGVAVEGGRRVLNVAQEAGGMAAQAAEPLREAAQGVGGLAADAGRQALKVAAGAGSTAVALGRQAQNLLAQAGGPIAHQAGQIAQALPQPVREAGQQAAGVAAAAKQSVREMMQGAKNRVAGGLAGLKEEAQVLAQQAGNAFGETKAGKVAIEARQMAVKLHENLGFDRGKLAIPHQYGGCITLENGGKNNPLGNHVTGALAKAYDRNAQQNLAVRAQVSLGQQRRGGGHGHGV